MAKFNFLGNLSVKWRLIGFVFFLLLLLVLTGFGALINMKTANRSLSYVYNEQVVPLKELKDLDKLFQVNIVTQVDKVLFEQITWEQCLDSVKQAQMDLEASWAAQFMAARAENDAWLTPARTLVATTDEAIPQLMALLKKQDPLDLDDFAKKTLYPLAAEYTKVVTALVNDRLDAVKYEYDNSQTRYTSSKKIFSVTLAVGICISLLASFLLLQSINKPLDKLGGAIKVMMRGDLSQHPDYNRNDEFGLLINGFNKMTRYIADLVNQVQRSGIQVTSSITEIAATNKQQEVTANEHAATASQIAASSTEIAATATQLLKTMKTVNSLTSNAAFAAEEGHAGLDNLDKNMVTMESATVAIVDKLSVLSEKAGNIAGVVKTINKVADQTNLLSLNAAIEAEKAGEYGAGFSVVATEIRRLADQTAVATFDIEQMVQDVQSAISASVMGIDKFAEDASHSANEVRSVSGMLGGVLEQVQILRPQVEVLNTGIEAQVIGANQISEAINQLNDATQQTAESLSQTSASIGQLQEAAMGLQEGITKFKLDDSITASSVEAFDEDEEDDVAPAV